jgi:hypothetical protein
MGFPSVDWPRGGGPGRRRAKRAYDTPTSRSASTLSRLAERRAPHAAPAAASAPTETGGALARPARPCCGSIPSKGRPYFMMVTRATSLPSNCDQIFTK